MPRAKLPSNSPKVKQLQALWIRALEEPVELPCGDKATAISVRFALYHAVKGHREGGIGTNPELTRAAAEVQITLTGPDSSTVRVAKSKANMVLDDVLTGLGIKAPPEESVVTEDDLAASFARLGQIKPEVEERISYTDLIAKYDAKDAGQ